MDTNFNDLKARAKICSFGSGMGTVLFAAECFAAAKGITLPGSDIQGGLASDLIISGSLAVAPVLALRKNFSWGAAALAALGATAVMVSEWPETAAVEQPKSHVRAVPAPSDRPSLQALAARWGLRMG